MARFGAVGGIATDASVAGLIDDEDSDTGAKLRAAFVPQEQVKLRKWYAALAKRNAAPAQVVLYADSIGEGTGATTILNRWQSVLQASLRTRYGVTTGALFPFIPARPATTTPGFPIASTGTVQGGDGQFGMGLRTATIPDATGTVTFTFTGTRGKLLFVRGSGTAIASIVVDGGAPVSFDCYHATITQGGYVYDTGALTAGVHTVTVSRSASSVAGRKVYCEGLLTYNGDEASGVRVLDNSRHGTNTAGLFTTNATIYQTDSLISAGNAGLAIIALGTNDVAVSITASAFQANIATFVAALRAKGFNGSILYLAVPKAPARTDAAWGEFVAAMKALAASDADAEFLDLGPRMPVPTSTPADASNLGLYADTTPHPTDAGHGWIADVVTGFISHR